MSHSESPVPPIAGTAVVLPGTGSDACFAEKAFGAELRRRSIIPIAVDPDPRGVVASYLTALDEAAENGPILVGGVSIGAAVALRWAYDNPDRVVGVLAALPAWTGDPREAPAAASARWTASELRAHGLDTVTAAMTASSPPWLARELTRSWSAQWPDLPSALDEAAHYRALDVDELRAVTVPVGIAAAVDDAVHPLAVARQWSREIPHAELATVTLEQVGDDPSVLGRLCLAALDRIVPVPNR
ncbi:alpha/beta hydrolase [Rhodococcus pyridinivorans]|uniref:Alpha/beta hydrolase n=1 Tax=Rhodococcus pyridinivorans TaxID=103816 RepID=A0A7M2XTJ4_9NOCA|nr:alpha/beta hydrolase [Rhodococcus pyridinivorans]QOW00633.1 alpha/beta hydrolase [Rhodococcus pyridinivorans]WMM74636.1 alpha/beta hydrolase [Rhodococcus pyridinivorans]